MKELFEEEVAVLGTIIAIALCKDAEDDELITIKNLISQIYSTLCTIVSQKIVGEKIRKKVFKKKSLD